MENITVSWWSSMTDVCTVNISLNKGNDGLTPYIKAGNWWIGLTDTGVKAEANSIVSIELISTIGLVKTYRITFTDTTHFDFVIADGAQGEQGIQGLQGIQGEKGDKGADGLTTSIDLNGTTYTQTGGTITLPDLLTPDGDGSTVTSDSADDADYNTEFPTQGNLWNLSAWFSLIKSKINRLFNLSPSVLNITATKVGDVITFNDFDIDEWIHAVDNTAEGKNIKIHYVLSESDTIIVNTYYNANLNANGIRIDCQDLSRAFYRYQHDPEGDWFPANMAIDGYLYTTGNGSDTTVNFTEAGVTALPASGEKQSTLWGKALRYFKTELPSLLSAKIDIQGGDATNAASASNASMTYDQTWPTYVTKWSLLNWFGAIRAKLDYLFGKRSLILNVTATRTLATDDWTFAAFSTTEFTAIAAIAVNGAPIYVRFSGTTGGVAEPVMMYPGLWNETLQQVTSRDLARGFYLNGGVSANRGARSYDTQKYIDLGATFNNVTGYYEYLGLTDIVEAECREAYYLTGSKTISPPNFYLFSSKICRFLFSIDNYQDGVSLQRSFRQSGNIQVIRLCKSRNLEDGIANLYKASTLYEGFVASSVTYVYGGIDISQCTTAGSLSAFTNANMRHILLYYLKVSVAFGISSSLDEASVLCMIQNRANGTTNITITLHPTAYAMALASTAIQAALVGSYITLASA